MKRAERIAREVENQPQGSIDPKFFNTVSQFAHFGMMFFGTVLIGTLFALAEHPFSGVLTGFMACTGYAVIHEFWYDPRYEDAETRGSDLEDFVFLMLGSCAGVIVLLVWYGISQL